MHWQLLTDPCRHAGARASDLLHTVPQSVWVKYIDPVCLVAFALHPFTVPTLAPPLPYLPLNRREETHKLGYTLKPDLIRAPCGLYGLNLLIQYPFAYLAGTPSSLSSTRPR